MKIENFGKNNFNKADKAKVASLISLYDQMKYNLDPVPSTITNSNMKNLMELTTIKDVKRYFKKLYFRELDFLAKKEWQQKNTKTSDTLADDDDQRAGIFNSSGELIYGIVCLV